MRSEQVWVSPARSKKPRRAQDCARLEQQDRPKEAIGYRGSKSQGSCSGGERVTFRFSGSGTRQAAESVYLGAVLKTLGGG